VTHAGAQGVGRIATIATALVLTGCCLGFDEGPCDLRRAAATAPLSSSVVCGDNSPARPAPNHHLGADLWTQFQPMDFCSGAQCPPLPAARDRSQWVSTTREDLFEAVTCPSSARCIVTRNATIGVWRTDLIEGRPVPLRNATGWDNICQESGQDGCWLAFPEYGENAFYLDEAEAVYLPSGEAVIAASGRSTVGASLWRLEAPAADERLRILYQDVASRSTAVDLVELGGRYAVACGVLGCHVYDADAALALPAPCLDDNLTELAENAQLLPERHPGSYTGSCGVRLGEIGDGESFAVVSSLTAQQEVMRSEPLRVRDDGRRSGSPDVDSEDGGTSDPFAVFRAAELEEPVEILRWLVATQEAQGKVAEAAGTRHRIAAVLWELASLEATIYSRAAVHGGAIYLLAGTSFSAELWRVNLEDPTSSELIWSTTEPARGVTLWSDGVSLWGAMVIAQGPTRTVKVYDFSAGGLQIGSFDVSGTPFATKDYLSYGEGWVYYAPATTFAGAGRLAGGYRERFFDVSQAPTITMLPRGETFTDPCSGQQVDYWGYMYPANDLGTRNVLPHRGSFVGDIFYRAAFGVLDGHRMPEHVAPPDEGLIFESGFETGDTGEWE